MMQVRRIGGTWRDLRRKRGENRVVDGGRVKCRSAVSRAKNKESRECGKGRNGKGALASAWPSGNHAAQEPQRPAPSSSSIGGQSAEANYLRLMHQMHPLPTQYQLRSCVPLEGSGSLSCR